MLARPPSSSTAARKRKYHDLEEPRSRSASPRATSRKFCNLHNWKPEKYQVEIWNSLNGRLVARGECNDLALASWVYCLASRHLLASPARLGISLGKQFIARDAGPPMYKLGRFARTLKFSLTMLAPEPCSYCKKEGISTGQFIQGAGINYLFREIDEPFEDFFWLHDECYCESVAKEFGWRVLRNWAALSRAKLRSSHHADAKAERRAMVLAIV